MERPRKTSPEKYELRREEQETVNPSKDLGLYQDTSIPKFTKILEI